MPIIYRSRKVILVSLFLVTVLSIPLLINVSHTSAIQAANQPKETCPVLAEVDGKCIEQNVAGDIEPMVWLPVTFANYCSDFYDDFSNTNSGWAAGSSSNFTYGYVDDQYSIKSKRSGFSFALESPSCRRVHYNIEVDGRWLGATGSSIGLVVAIEGSYETFYTFEINTDAGQYRSYRIAPGLAPELIALDSSLSIQSGNGWNHLKAVVSKPWLIFYINGDLIMQLEDASLAAMTGAGLMIIPYEDRAIAEARFDNFIMRQLTSDELPTNPVNGSSQSKWPESVAPPSIVEPGRPVAEGFLPVWSPQ